jgi:predicted nucleic acid-binding protein
MVGEPAEMAERARSVVEGETGLLVTSDTIAETCYALASNYGVARAAIVDSVSSLLARRNIDTIPFPKTYAIQALGFCRDAGRVSFADAMLWASAASRGDRVITFDRRFPADSIEVVFPT